MNNTQLKLKVIELSKTLKRNEVYDYILAKYFASNRDSNGCISVNDIENVTGLKIKDVVMMNKLIFYWTTFLTEEQLIQKVANILIVIDCYTPQEREEIIQLHRAKDDLMAKIHKVLTILFKNNAA